MKEKIEIEIIRLSLDKQYKMLKMAIFYVRLLSLL